MKKIMLGVLISFGLCSSALFFGMDDVDKREDNRIIQHMNETCDKNHRRIKNSFALGIVSVLAMVSARYCEADASYVTALSYLSSGSIMAGIYFNHVNFCTTQKIDRFIKNRDQKKSSKKDFQGGIKLPPAGAIQQRK